MKRTTLAIEPVILREIKQRAARRGTTLQSEVNGLLRQALRTRQLSGFKLQFEPLNLELQPGIDLFDRDSLYRAMEGK